MSLEGKRALVTGASGSLGTAIAERLARDGATVLLHANGRRDAIEALASRIAASGGQAECHVFDLTSDEGTAQACARILEVRPVQVLVNNAGGPPAGTFDDFSDAAWQKAYELNLLSYIRTIRAALPSMRQLGIGRIVNFTSSSVKQVLENLILSNTFRLGVMGLTKTLSQELGKENILVNVMGPGRIETARIQQLDQIRAAKAGIPLEQVYENMIKTIPLGRYGTPEEFAKLAVFLCSEANTYITGQTVLVDGGMTKTF